jgi:hypothetical protein
MKQGWVMLKARRPPGRRTRKHSAMARSKRAPSTPSRARVSSTWRGVPTKPAASAEPRGRPAWPRRPACGDSSCHTSAPHLARHPIMEKGIGDVRRIYEGEIVFSTEGLALDLRR